MPSPACENTTGELGVFEDVHEPVVSEPLGQVKPQLSSENFELGTVDMLVGDPVPVLLVDIVTDLVPLQFLIVGQKKWCVDLGVRRIIKKKVQYRSFSGRIVLLGPFNRKYLQDLVHVSIRLVQPSSSDQIG